VLLALLATLGPVVTPSCEALTLGLRPQVDDRSARVWIEQCEFGCERRVFPQDARSGAFVFNHDVCATKAAIIQTNSAPRRP